MLLKYKNNSAPDDLINANRKTYLRESVTWDNMASFGIFIEIHEKMFSLLVIDEILSKNYYRYLKCSHNFNISLLILKA